MNNSSSQEAAAASAQAQISSSAPQSAQLLPPQAGPRRPSTSSGTSGAAASLDPRSFMNLAREELRNAPKIMEEFLITMREFRVEELSMNEVISRIIRLFRGRRRLLEAFNSFLPDNCKLNIDAVMQQSGSAIEDEAPPVKPSGGASTDLQAYLAHPPPSSPWGVPIAGPPSSFPSLTPKGSLAPPPPSAKGAPPGPQGAPGAAALGHMVPQHPMMPPGRPPVPGGMPHAAISQPPLQQPQPIAATGPSASVKKIKKEELEPAVKFIQKIRSRFSSEPEVFKTFLDIVDEFQNEQRSLTDLYLQINTLFSGHPDLIEDFRLFLPEQFAALNTMSLQPPSHDRHGRQYSIGAPRPQQPAPQQPPRQPQPASGAPPRYSSQPPRRAKQLPNLEDFRQSAEEADFFEKVKRFLNSKQVYAEFLRCLNLFNQDLISMKELIRTAHTYLGRAPDLFGWFKRYVGYKGGEGDGAHPAAAAPSAAAGASIPQVDINTCKKYGSYRLLPKMYRNVVCSGRTDLSREVLNDLLVGCPQFASEEGSFIASKKNQYEEVMFKCEDDRFELDMLIDTNLATIHVLEAVDRKIQAMTPQERSALRLNANLGLGTSTTIYRKALSRIYGERVGEVMEGLYNNPVAAVPVVLNRLYARNEEWRKVQREYQVVWREIHVKNYYKALDHQSINFKNVDKKALNAKALISEVEMVARETRHPSAAHQVLAVGNPGVLKDYIKIVAAFIKKVSNLQSHEKSRLISFFDSFFPTVFGFAKLPSMTAKMDPAAAESFSNPYSTEGSESSENDDESADLSSTESRSSPEYTTRSIFYSNGLLYALIKTFEIGYARIARHKTGSSPSPSEAPCVPAKNPFAVSLDLQQPSVEFSSGSSSYSILIKMLSKFVVGSLEQNYFEERIRFLFGAGSFPLFTFDKLVSSLVRQAQVVLADGTCDNLLRLFDTIKTKPKKAFTEYSIKLATESLMNQDSESIYRIELTKPGSLAVRLLDRKHHYDPGLDEKGLESIEERWSRYIEKFMNDIDYSIVRNRRPPLLPRRVLRKAGILGGDCPDRPWPHVLIRYEMECKISVNTYKMNFVEDSEDFVLNTRHWQQPRQIGKKSLDRVLERLRAKL